HRAGDAEQQGGGGRGRARGGAGVGARGARGDDGAAEGDPAAEDGPERAARHGGGGSAGAGDVAQAGDDVAGGGVMREPHPTPATRLVDALVRRHGKAQAHVELDHILDRLPVVDLAALAFDWSSWARPKQIIPSGGEWRSFGYLTGRGWGKSLTCASHIVGEAEAGRARCIGLAAQNEEKTIAVQVAGLIEASPPWFRPDWTSSANQLTWPNGAVALAFTPEVPGAIRSPNFDLTWLSEVQSWPTATREEALLNFQFATRVGYARTIWDATPKRRHPILRRFLARAASEPDRHIVVRGTMRENRRNLAASVIEDLEREYAGTTQGREE